MGAVVYGLDAHLLHLNGLGVGKDIELVVLEGGEDGHTYGVYGDSGGDAAGGANVAGYKLLALVVRVVVDGGACRSRVSQ